MADPVTVPAVCMTVSRKIVALAQTAWELTQIATQNKKDCQRVGSRLEVLLEMMRDWQTFESLGVVEGASKDAFESLKSALEDVNLTLQAMAAKEGDNFTRRVKVFLNGRTSMEALKKAESSLNSALLLFESHKTNHILRKQASVGRHVQDFGKQMQAFFVQMLSYDVQDTTVIPKTKDMLLPASLQAFHADVECTYDDAEFIGEGGFSEVFHGTYKNTEVAIKRIKVSSKDVKKLSRKEVSKDERRLQAEAKILHECSVHPNILQIYGCCADIRDRRRPLIILELMETTLFDAIHDDQLPSYRKRRSLMRGVSRALEFMHLQGIVHHDIKSLNILLDKDMKVAKLSDFGEAKVKGLLSSTKYTMTSIDLASRGRHRWRRPSGTTQYLAPEVILGKTSGSSRAADIYAFGVTLWECITTQVPHQHEGDPRDVSLVVAQKAKSKGRMLAYPSEPPPGLSKEDAMYWWSMWRISKNCTRRDPKTRQVATEITYKIMRKPFATAKQGLADESHHTTRTVLSVAASSSPSTAQVPPTLVPPLLPPSDDNPRLHGARKETKDGSKSTPLKQRTKSARQKQRPKTDHDSLIGMSVVLKEILPPKKTKSKAAVTNTVSTAPESTTSITQDESFTELSPVVVNPGHFNTNGYDLEDPKSDNDDSSAKSEHTEDPLPTRKMPFWPLSIKYKILGGLMSLAVVVTMIIVFARVDPPGPPTQTPTENGPPTTTAVFGNPLEDDGSNNIPTVLPTGNPTPIVTKRPTGPSGSRFKARVKDYFKTFP